MIEINIIYYITHAFPTLLGGSYYIITYFVRYDESHPTQRTVFKSSYNLLSI